MNTKNKINIMDKISDDMRLVIEYQLSSAKELDSATLTNEQMRQNYEDERKFWNENPPLMFESREFQVEFKNRSVKAVAHYPSKQDEYKAIFFIHGGGWVVGSINTHDRIMKTIAEFSGCAVIGIDYTLAPDEKFPTQLEECVCVIEHVIKNASEFKINPNSIAYAGDSCGANMCMGTYLYQRNMGKDVSFVKAMALFYGLFGLKDSVTRTLYGSEIDWLREEDFEYYYNEYLADKKDAQSPFVNVFNADLTKDVPPCFIAPCEFDPLKDDSVALYQILKQYNQSEFKEYKGVIHAFLHFSRMMPIAKEAMRDGSNFIKKFI
ncbi:alpha/beta hydrolase fold domain-containing protein [Campylobacter sp. RM16188]|uniref:alpha/beta hydrolase fold domain-containing protein n=1 Tax=Campylobacter sp. RM16188 TaxID=1705725 RepID=UPI0015528EBA|nr:alpha/beta hydrolase fold domain-containing protein [Campylobacter sp. RM16188]